MNKFFYGAHFSISKGIYKTIDNALEYNCNMIQIFVSNPMGRSNDNKIDYYLKESDKIQEYLKEKDMKIVIHAPYILNLAKIPEFGKNESWWIKALWKELLISHYIGSLGVVFHVGKYLDLTILNAKMNMYKTLKYLINKMKDDKLETYLILETSAGQGTELFASRDNDISEFSDFYHMFTKQEKKYLKICVDTCHIFTAGYDIRTKKQVNNFFNTFNSLIGLEHLVLIHLNDSKSELSQNVDRHANLGQGKIGLNGLKQVIKIAKQFNIPTILETPESSQDEINLIKKISK